MSQRLNCLQTDRNAGFNTGMGLKGLRYFLLSCMLVPVICAVCQQQHVRFEHIGTSMGLSQSNVICIFQDSRGFMWFGTRDGLNKYDGYKFTVYKFDAENKNSLSDNSLYDIKEDREGNLWIATWGGGLDKFDWEKEKFVNYKNDPKDPHSLGEDYLNKLMFDEKGDLWVGTEGGGLSLLDRKTNKFINYLHHSNDPHRIDGDKVKDIKQDKAHNIWIGTDDGGLESFDRKTKTFKHFQPHINNSASLSSNLGGSILIDSKDQIWVGTRGGLLLFDRVKERFTPYVCKINGKDIASVNTIRKMDEDDRGNLWIATENGGLNVFNTETRTFQNYAQDDADNTSLSDNSVYSVFKDAKGNMWVGTFSEGLNFLNFDASKFIHYRHNSSPQSLGNNKVLAIFEDDKKNLWFGTDGGGLDLFDEEKGTFIHYLNDPLRKNSLSGNYVLSIAGDSKGNIWVGTWGNGITVFNKEKNTFKRFVYNASNPKGLSSPHIRAIFRDHEENVWIVSFGAGISRYDQKNDNFVHYSNDPANASSIGNNYVNFIWEDKEHNLWIGTNGNGLDLFDKKTNTFTHFLSTGGKNNISNSDVYCIGEDKKGNLWLGTGGGLNMMDKTTRQFTSYYVNQGLPSNLLSALLVDEKGILWISTLNGISRFDPEKKAFINFGINDGLQSKEFKVQSACKSHRGKMYFGGINGFNEFSPDSIKEKIYEPPLVFTDFQIFNKQILVSEEGSNTSPLKKNITDTKELTLAYSQSVISFEFASLNYTISDKKQYSYRLVNFDQGWNNIGTRHSATYTNLDPGKYVLRVRGLSNDGKWSTNEVEMKIIITPPYWKTWWFRLLLFVFIVGGAIAFYKFRMSVIKAQKIILQQKVQQQTIELVHLNEEERMARFEAEHARAESEHARQLAHHANEELQIKNKQLEQFAYVASHDLQEPLRTTASFVELIQQQYKGKIDEKADKYLAFIAEATARMKVLINDLLDFAKIGTLGELKRIDCNVMLGNLLADLTAAIQASKAHIQYADLPVISGYPTEIKLLFQNLLINAIKFRKKDVNPCIKITATEKQGCWEFAISDNGIGIEKIHNKKIFDIFQRLHTRKEYEGSGIGLSHCKKIVELHHGKIWIESIPGEGSTFHFTLLMDKKLQPAYAGST